MTKARQVLAAICLVVSTLPAAAGADEEAQVLEPIRVTGQRVANQQPATTYANLATALRFDPQVDLQTRGLPEGQADVTIRGGIFENTAFRVGAVTVFDPQTGHYSVEQPFDPAMFMGPAIRTDFDHALGGFNATVATVTYGFRPPGSGGTLLAGVGSDNLRYGLLRTAFSRERQGGGEWGGLFSVAASKGDGTLPFGDHDFKRISGQLRFQDDHSETNLLAGYHDKFFGWPGAYTGFASLPETDHTKLVLVLANHRRWSQSGWWEIGAFYRELDDDYDFDRRTQECCAPGSFEHLTRAAALGLAGKQSLAGLDWHFAAQLAADRLVRSTDLTHGNFNSRSYLMLSLAPEKTWTTANGRNISLRAGLRFDDSNRDESALMPLISLSLEQAAGEGLNRFTLDYSGSSQLPGYTALNSRPAGLFGGNPDLGREYADTLTLSFTHDRVDWMVSAAFYHRKDDDLVDWTFRAGAPFARQANPVDLDVNGFEAIAGWRGDVLELVGSYAWLDKEADYGNAEVDASYYALNYARHRLTLALIWTPLRQLEFRMDNEYRRQQDNPLRDGRDTAWLASLSARWRPDWSRDFSFSLVADNLTDSDFQEFPGTPAMGRQISLGVGLDW